MEADYINPHLSEEDIKRIAREFIDNGKPNPSKNEVWDAVSNLPIYVAEFEYAWDNVDEDDPDGDNSAELKGLFDEVSTVADMVIKEINKQK